MKNIYLFISFSFFSGNILAQTFADPNFTAIPVGSGWNSPAGAVFSNDGQKLFVWERAGKLYVCNRDGSGNYIKQTTPVADIAEEVANWDAHGMLGFAMDPGFETNGLIYLLYVVDRHHLLNFGTPAYNPNISISGQATIGRVTRYQTITSGNNLVVNSSTRQILIGETKSTGMPILHHSHGIGTLAFAADGTLLVTIGDAASYEGNDSGSEDGTFYQQALDDGIIRLAENVGAFRAQMVNSMSGKLLRIDPQTGNGVPSNPFYSAAEPRAPKSRVWALGIRNSFRIFVKPGTGSTDPAVGDIGEVFLGDVGFASWEEMNICKAPGTNFGWPIYEGNEYTIPLDGVGGITYKDLNVFNQDEPNPLYGTGGCNQPYFYFHQLIKQANIDDNKTIYNQCNSSVVSGSGNRYYHRRPSLEWSHAHPWARVGIFNGTTPTVAMIGSPESQVTGTPFSGQCSVGGILYTGNTFPLAYKNTYFQADFASGWIKRITLDNADIITRVDNFASGYTEIVCIAQHPTDGSLVTVQLGSTTGVKKVQYGGNQPPIANLAANVNYGSSPLTVSFTGGNSFDPTPGGSIISYAWNFGGGNPATSNVANPGNIVFTDNTGNPKKFVVKLTVTDNGGATHTDSIIVSVNNTAPVVNITSPIKNSLYKQGPDTIYACAATVSDAQHSGSQLKYEWQTTLRHNNHEHREAIDNAVNTNTLIQRVGFYGSDVYYWLIELKVTDAAGLSTKDSAKIFPDLSTGGDITPPTVSSASPANGATGVATNTIVTATFNEAINASTITGTTFQLKDPGNNLIAASLSTLSNQITLTTSAALTGSTVYTATITGGTNGVKDFAGNALVNNYSWTFTTAVVDNIPPTVSSVIPVNGATGVNTNTTVTANFSEAINASTVTTSTVQLRNPANALVTANVSLSGNQVTLTPSAALTVSTVYTATITGGVSGVKDIAGNALATDYSWSFTTAAASSQSPVTIQSANTKTGTTATVHALTGVPAAALLVLTTTADAVVSNCIVTSSPSLTWTKQVDAGATNSDNAEIWTAVYTAGGSISVTSNWGAGNSQASVCYIVLNAEPVLGGAFGTATLQASPSVTVTTTRDNSIIFGCTADWKSINGATRTLRDAATERLYFKDGNYATYHYTKSAATIAAYTEGVSLPTGMQASTALLEIRSNAVSANVPPTVTTQPTSQTRCAGTNATFSSAASGTPTPTVQWQVSTNGTTWTNINGATSTTLTFATSTADNNKQYRAVWTNIGGPVNSNPAILTVNPIPVLSSNLTATAASGIAFTYTATSSTSVTTFAWSRAAVTGISNASANGTGNINETLVNTTASAVNVTYVYTLTANSCANTQNVVVTVNTGVVSPTVTTQPLSQTKCVGTNASFISAASGIPTPTVQWQVSTNGTTWTNITGATSATLSFATSAADNNKQYRAVWTNSGGPVNSNPAILTVNPIPVLLSNLTASATSGTAFTYTPTSSTMGTTFSWSRAAVSDISNTATNGTGNINETLVNTTTLPVDVTYVYTLTANLCTNTQDVIVTVNAEEVIISPTVTTQPLSQTKCAVENVTFTSAASGTPAPTVQWQQSIDGTLWSNITGATSATLSFVTTTADNNKQYRAVWTNSGGPVNSNPAILTVNPIPSAPEVSVADNCGSSVLTAASYSGSLLWSTGATTETITVTTIATYTVRQTVSNCTSAAGNGPAAPKPIPALSSSLTGTATSGTAFIYTPTSTTSGTTFNWTRAAVTEINNASANGTGNINETLINTTVSPVNVTYVYTLTANSCTNTQHVVVTVNVGEVIVSPTVTTQPVSQTKCVGTNASFISAASGTPTPTVQWQESTNGTTWTNITGATSATLSFVTSVADNNKQYRAVWTNSGGPVNSNPAILTVNPIPVLSSNLTATAASGIAFTYTATSSTSGTTFAWSRAAVAGISNASTNGTGNINETLVNTTASAVNVTYVYTLIANSCTNTQNIVVTVNTGVVSPTVTTQPTSQTKCAGTNASFISAASGTPTPTVQWQVSTNGSTWTNITGATNATLSFATSPADNNKQYRAVWTNSGGPVNSNPAILTVNPIPVLSSNLTASATSGTAFSYIPTSISTGTIFTWTRAVVAEISNTAGSGTGAINETLVNTTTSAVNVTYVYTLTANGCVNTQNLVVTVNPATTVNCVINGSITSTFNSTAIPAGRYIWFNSSFNPGSLGSGTAPVTIIITNSVITFTANSVQYILNVPNSRIRYDAAVTSASTQFINNVWETVVPSSYSGYVFMGGLSYQVLSNLPGSISNIRWTANISIDKSNISLTWRWAAAVYTSFTTHSGLNIKPKNGNTQNPYNNNDNAGTPENFKSSVVSGAKGTGGTNYTGTNSSTSTATCVVTAAQRSSVQPITTRQSFGKQIPALSIENLAKENLEVNVMPNPSNTFFNLAIRGNNKNPVTIRVIDVFGQVVERHEKITANAVLQMGHKWTSGLYFVEVIQVDQRKFVKIIKVN